MILERNIYGRYCLSLSTPLGYPVYGVLVSQQPSFKLAFGSIKPHREAEHQVGLLESLTKLMLDWARRVTVGVLNNENKPYLLIPTCGKLLDEPGKLAPQIPPTLTVPREHPLDVGPDSFDYDGVGCDIIWTLNNKPDVHRLSLNIPE